MFEGTKAAIQKSFVVKEHFEKAAQLNPSDATSHYLLGMWCASQTPRRCYGSPGVRLNSMPAPARQVF